MARIDIKKTLFIVFSLYGIAMVTASESNETMLTGIIQDGLNGLVGTFMEGIEGSIGSHITYDISNVMITNLSAPTPSITIMDGMADVELDIPTFVVSADWEAGWEFKIFGCTLKRSGDFRAEADRITVNAVYSLPRFQIQSCEATFDEFDVDLNGNGILVAIASLIVESGSVEDTIKTRIGEAICNALERREE